MGDTKANRAGAKDSADEDADKNKQQRGATNPGNDSILDSVNSFRKSKSNPDFLAKDAEQEDEQLGKRVSKDDENLALQINKKSIEIMHGIYQKPVLSHLKAQMENLQKNTIILN